MKRIKDYFPNVYDRYYLTENGELYTDYGNKVMSNNAIQNGYIVNSLYGKNGYRKDYKRHVLMAKIFLDKPKNFQTQINHKNGNKLDNRADNLEWVTSKQNIQHAWANNLAQTRKGSKSNFSKLNEEQVLEISKLLEQKVPGKEIAEKFNVDKRTISAIKCRHNWKHLTKDFNF